VLLALLLGHNSGNVLWWLVGGNVAGNLLQAAIFSAWWHRHQPAHQEQIPLEQIRDALAWRRTSVMGLAWFCNMAFASIDMLMLGVMSNPRQVGLYSAAYRILSQVLFTYYLMTSVLYPQLARQSREQRLSMLRSRILLTVGGLGFVIAGIVTLVRRRLSGRDLAADAARLGNTAGLRDVVPHQRIYCLGHGEADPAVYVRCSVQ
jgi:O-antigen/teichoic acid export membrane protein